MGNIALVTDSTADVPSEFREKYKINVVDAYVHFGDDTYTSENLSMKEFHDMLATAKGDRFPKTSQPSSQDFLEMYEQLKDEGYDQIISIHVGNEFAGTLNSAKNAISMVEDIEILLVDSHTVSIPLFVCLVKARELIDAGEEIEQIKTTIEEMGPKLEGFISLETMENLKKGGRIGQIRYRFGRFLNIKPILRLGDGKIDSFDKVRGLKKSRKKAYEYAVEEFGPDDEFYYIIAHCDAKEIATKYEKVMINEYRKAKGAIMEIGMAVSVHAGRKAFYVMTFTKDQAKLNLD